MSGFGDFTRCPGCGEYRWSERPHSCPPLWHVHHEESHGPLNEFEDHASIHAHDAQEAAEKWADRYDAESLEYTIVGGTSVEVRVRSFPDGEWVWYTVSGEAVPQYRAETGRLDDQ